MARARRKGIGADHHPAWFRQRALRLTTARYFTPSGRSIQAKAFSPDIEVLQEVPDELKTRTDTRAKASLRGHLQGRRRRADRSQSYIPPDPKMTGAPSALDRHSRNPEELWPIRPIRNGVRTNRQTWMAGQAWTSPAMTAEFGQAGGQRAPRIFCRGGTGAYGKQELTILNG